LAEVPDHGFALHKHVVTPFLRLRQEALSAGFELKVVSSFRDFDRQVTIWNEKFTGRRLMVDAAGRPLEAASMAAQERIAAILLWSALPGASRHHWGTDVDLVDARAIPPGYRVRLASDEFAPSGPFAPLAAWLDQHASRFGFFRPFRGVLSGVQAEPWHLSFAPVAEPARRSLTPAVLRHALTAAAIEGKASVLDGLNGLHARYVSAIDWP
jgi:LAS superfamily LD-carboxypeptidase LdcB